MQQDVRGRHRGDVLHRPAAFRPFLVDPPQPVAERRDELHHGGGRGGGARGLVQLHQQQGTVALQGAQHPLHGVRLRTLDVELDRVHPLDALPRDVIVEAHRLHALDRPALGPGAPGAGVAGTAGLASEGERGGAVPQGRLLHADVVEAVHGDVAAQAGEVVGDRLEAVDRAGVTDGRRGEQGVLADVGAAVHDGHPLVQEPQEQPRLDGLGESPEEDVALDVLAEVALDAAAVDEGAREPAPVAEPATEPLGHGVARAGEETGGAPGVDQEEAGVAEVAHGQVP